MTELSFAFWWAGFIELKLLSPMIFAHVFLHNQLFQAYSKNRKRFSIGFIKFEYFWSSNVTLQSWMNAPLFIIPLSSVAASLPFSLIFMFFFSSCQWLNASASLRVFTLCAFAIFIFDFRRMRSRKNAVSLLLLRNSPRSFLLLFLINSTFSLVMQRKHFFLSSFC